MKLKWLRFFESRTTNEDSEEGETLFLKDKVKLFFKTFRYQSMQYQIVWPVRILCWILIIAAGLYGLTVRIITYFK